LDCRQNLLSKIDVTHCTELGYFVCSTNALIELDLAPVLGFTLYFNGSEQSPLPITLYKNEAGEYIRTISLNAPTFKSNAISYSDGILKSTDTAVSSTYFTVKTNKVGYELYELSGTMKFSYSDDVGINSQDRVGLKVYSNPTTEELRITNYESRINNVEIYDMNGRKQKAESGKQKAENEIVIDIFHLPTGVYFVKVMTEQGEIVRKIVKQ
jgi:hypothetical protein